MLLRYMRPIQKIVVYYLRKHPDHDARQRKEDLLQTAYVAFIEHIRSDQVQSEEDIEPIYYTIVGALWTYTAKSGLVSFPRNATKEQVQQAQNIVTFWKKSEDETLYSPICPPEDDNIVYLADYRQMLTELNDLDRQIVSRLYAGETQREVATSLHIPQAAVSRRINRARPFIYSHLA